MGSALAIVSKAVFEKQAAGASLGQVLALDRYASTHKSLETLADGGALFLVTVRPPDEQLWLVAVLDAPKLGKAGWTAAPNQIAITDISKLRTKLKFSTGTGIQAKAGALGMSLQTPRVLTDADVALLRGATGGKTPAKVVAPAPLEIAKSKSKAKPAEPDEPIAKSKPEPIEPAEVAVGADLAALQAAFAAKDGAAALATAVAWWRIVRAPALADLIDAISERVSGAVVTTEMDFTKLAMAKNPLDLGRLLPAVAQLPVNFLPTAAQLLAEYPDDPRIAMAHARWALDPLTTSTSKNKFWTQMFEVSARIGDTRVIPVFKKRLARAQEKAEWWAKFYAAIERLLAKLPPPGTLDAKPLAKLGAAVTKLSPITSRAVVRATEPVPPLSGPLLAQAAQHIAAGRIAPAIAALVERWRETRVPELADLIDRATRMLPTYDLPLAPTEAALQPAWMAAFGADPQAAMPQLLDNVFAGQTKLAELRLAQLATLPDDPRIALRLAAASRGVASPTASQFWGNLFEILAKTRDVRTCAPLRQTFSDFTSTYYYHHKKGKRIVGNFAIHPETCFDAWPLALDASDRALIAPLEKALAAAEAKSRERSLVAAIAEDWDSDGPRLVYADWLTEREHPRGELIVLACKKQRSADETARYKELIAVPKIFGILEDFAEGPLVLDRGLVRNVAARGTSLTWRAFAQHPLLALIETLGFAQYANDPSAEAFALVVANAPSLRTIRDARGDNARWAVIEPAVDGRFKLEGHALVRA